MRILRINCLRIRSLACMGIKLVCGCLHAVKRGYDNCILLRVYSLGSGTMNGRKRNGKRDRKKRRGMVERGGKGGKDEAPLKLFLRHASLTSSVSWSWNILKFYDNNHSLWVEELECD